MNLRDSVRAKICIAPLIPYVVVQHCEGGEPFIYMVQELFLGDSMRKPYEIIPQKCAFLIIDVLNAGHHPKGALRDFVDAKTFDPTVVKIKRVISVCRNKKIPVIFVRCIYRPGGADVGPFYPMKFGEKWKYLVEGDWNAEVLDELRPSKADYTVIKRRPNAFYMTDLEILLKGLQVDTVVFSGCSTEGCIESTARGAWDRDYKIVYLSDCCASPDPQKHKSALERVPTLLTGIVMTSSEFIDLVKAKG